MKTLWPTNFQTKSISDTKSILETQARALPDLTNNLVWAEVSEVSPQLISNEMRNDFVYRFDIYGKELKNYRYTMLTFSHDIGLFPVKFSLDNILAEEIGLETSPFAPPLAITTESDLDGFIAIVLQSKRVSNVIGSIMHLSKQSIAARDRIS